MISPSKTVILIIIGLIFGFVPYSSHANDDIRTYTIKRNGDAIGTHKITVKTAGNDGEQTQVDITTSILINSFFSPSYSYSFTSQEIWQNFGETQNSGEANTLVSFSSKTIENGRSNTLTIKNEGPRLVANAVSMLRDQMFYIAPQIAPGNFWRMPDDQTKDLIDVVSGQTLNVKLKWRGPNHIQIRGQLTREVWFDETGRLIKMQFPDKSGVLVTYSLD